MAPRTRTNFSESFPLDRAERHAQDLEAILDEITADVVRVTAIG
jgi:hypothetical protein